MVKLLSAPATQTSPDEKPCAPSEADLRSDMAVHKAARPDRGERPVAQRPHSQETKLGMPQPTPMAGRRNTSLWCPQTKTRRHPEGQRRRSGLGLRRPGTCRTFKSPGVVFVDEKGAGPGVSRRDWL